MIPITLAMSVAHAQQLGMTVGKGVTKKTDLLVAHDVGTRSGKAAKARNYGVPVLSSEQFADAQIGDLLEAQGSSTAALKVITCPDCLATWTMAATTASRSRRRCDSCAETPPSRRR
jgi:hypothetical protein